MPGETNFGMIKREIISAFGLATREQAEELLHRAQMEVPVGNEPVSGSGTAAHPPGELRDSGTVEATSSTTNWVVSFNTPYAKKQHEAQGFSHPPAYSNSIQPGKAKYLEDPLKAMAVTMDNEIAKEMRKILATTVRDSRGRFARLGTPGAAVSTRSEPWTGGGGLAR